MRDEQFVNSLADKYKTQIHLQRFDTKKYVESNKISVQEAARTLRYNWFAELVANGDAPNVVVQSDSRHHQKNIILTAHHADDNIETLLMHFFRGTGIHGLTGIAPLQEEEICCARYYPLLKGVKRICK